MVTVYCFGSPNEGDSLAWELADLLRVKGVSFEKCSRVEDILDADGTVWLMDVVKGLNKVTIIDDVKKLESGNIVSLHDFDIGFFTKLLSQLRDVKVRIIGLPYGSNSEEVMADLVIKLNSIRL